MTIALDGRRTSLDYENIRPFINTGDLVAFTHRGWKSWSDIESQIVRMATRSEYSHVGLLWETNDRVFVIEAVIPEIRIFPLSNFTEFYILNRHIDMSKEAEDYMLSKIGGKYSKLEAIKGYFGKTKGDENWQCAELVNSVYRRDGILLPGKDTPTDVVRGAMEKYGWKLQLIMNRG